MDFALFLLVNAILFLRPAEIVPALEGLPIYYFAMLACIAASSLSLIRLFTESPLLKHPTVLCVFAMFGFASIALFVNLDVAKAVDEQIEFAKAIVYLCLFLAVVRTPARLQGVIACVVVCMTVSVCLAILHYHEAIKIDLLKPQEELLNKPSVWSEEVIRRLRLTGILHDANEAGVFCGVLTFLCGYQLGNRRLGLLRVLWIAPIGVFLYALYLTQSRGGLLALMVGMTAFALYGFQPKTPPSLGAPPPKRIPVAGLAFLLVAIPLVLILFAGRQTDVSTNATTAQTRFGLWSDWLQDFRDNPLFGVGPKILSTELKPDETGRPDGWKLLAHNSYLQGFADMGFFGGVAFLGAVGFALLTMHRYGFNQTWILDPDLARLQPYLMAALCVYCLGFFTLTINYILPSFFVLALPVAYYGMTPSYPPIPRPRLTPDTLARLFVLGIGFIGFTYVVCRVMPKQ